MPESLRLRASLNADSFSDCGMRIDGPLAQIGWCAWESVGYSPGRMGENPGATPGTDAPTIIGRIDPEGAVPVSFETALDSWRDELARTGCQDTARRVKRVQHVAAACKWANTGDIVAVSIRQHMTERRLGRIDHLGRKAESLKNPIKPMGTKYHNNLLCELRAFCAFCRLKGWMPRNPAEDVSLIGSAGRDMPEERGAFDFPEVLRLVEAARADEASPEPRYSAKRSALYLLLFFTSWRKGEAFRMRRGDFIRGEAPAVVGWTGRQRKTRRTIPLHPLAACALDEMLGPGGDPKDLIWSKAVCDRVLRGDMAAAKVPAEDAQGRPRLWHSFRAGAATHQIARGTNIRAVQALLGHADIRTTQRYIKFADSDLIANAVKNFGEMDLKSLDRGGGMPDSDGVTAMLASPTHHDSANPAAPERAMAVTSGTTRVRPGFSRRDGAGEHSANGAGGNRTPRREESGGTPGGRLIEAADWDNPESLQLLAVECLARSARLRLSRGSAGDERAE